MLHIEIIGIPRIMLGRKIPRKARALLFYVALQEGARASRVRLADILWPYQGSELSRHSLRNCLLELRRALRMDGVAACLGSDFVDVWLTDFSLDLHQFGSLCAADRLVEAIGLCRGELFQELEFDSEPFNEWVTVQREQFAASSAAAMSRLASEQTAAGQYEEAMRVAKKAIAIDPWNEDLHRLYMRAAAKSGRRAPAIAHYAAFARELKTELGTVPDGETITLAKAIEHGLLSARQTSAPVRAAEIMPQLVPSLSPKNNERLQAIENRCREIDMAVRSGFRPQVPPSLIREIVSALEAERLRKTGAALAA